VSRENLWGGDLPDGPDGPDEPPYRTSEVCGGVRFEPEGSKGSFNIAPVLTAFFTVGAISIIGHLINRWIN
jgi:hypothetical protein